MSYAGRMSRAALCVSCLLAVPAALGCSGGAATASSASKATGSGAAGSGATGSAAVEQAATTGATMQEAASGSSAGEAPTGGGAGSVATGQAGASQGVASSGGVASQMGSLGGSGEPVSAQGGTPGAEGGAGPTPPQACCDAAAVCDAGDTQISGPEDCPAGVTCYPRTVCCDSIWCAPHVEVASCNAFPACDEGDTALAAACPQDIKCYTVELCGSSVTCLPQALGGTGGQCDPDDHNRQYAGTSANQCAVIRFACAENTNAFSDDCGCGCEQMEACPTQQACVPAGAPEPELCYDDRCPFSAL